jgi:hypothetical protein
MSITLHWKIENLGSKQLSYELKKILTKKWCISEAGKLISGAHVPYLEGLSDAGVKGAQDLLDALETHKTLRVFTVM